MTRDDLALRTYAKQLGYREELNVQDRQVGNIDHPNFTITFIKGDTYIWFTRLGWRVAELTGDGSGESVQYRNHRTEKSLQIALEKNSQEKI